MKAETVDLSRLAEALEGLRAELGRLGERVAALEAVATARPAAAGPPRRDAAAAAAPAARPAAESGLSEELVLVISAAVAAFLGKRPHIRQIRLIGSAAWAQQGRVTIQASHSLSVQSRS
jgi:methylmalonyl-CoA carboxyltransferase large subunit